MKEGKELPDELNHKLSTTQDKVRQLEQQTSSTPNNTPSKSGSGGADGDSGESARVLREKVRLLFFFTLAFVYLSLYM